MRLRNALGKKEMPSFAQVSGRTTVSTCSHISRDIQLRHEQLGLAHY